MSVDIQVIERNGKPEYAVVPYEIYLQLVEEADMLEDIRDFDEIKAAIDRGEEELIPSEVVNALLDGENPIKVWREFRGLAQRELAASAGISPAYLSQIESGKRKGATSVLVKLARCLKLNLDDLV